MIGSSADRLLAGDTGGRPRVSFSGEAWEPLAAGINRLKLGLLFVLKRRRANGPIKASARRSRRKHPLYLPSKPSVRMRRLKFRSRLPPICLLAASLAALGAPVWFAAGIIIVIKRFCSPHRHTERTEFTAAWSQSAHSQRRGSLEIKQVKICKFLAAAELGNACQRPIGAEDISGILFGRPAELHKRI